MIWYDDANTKEEKQQKTRKKTWQWRDLSSYESCFWSATSLYSAIKEKQNSETTTSTDNPTHVCPMCDKDSVVLIPLQENEAIKCQWDTKEVSKYCFLYWRLKIVASILTFEDPSPFNLSLGLQHIS